MYAAFVKLLNMSAASGILIAVVIVLRMLLRRIPKKYICLLWAVVALRLVCPFSISSPVSAYNYIGNHDESTGQVEYIHYNGKSETPKAEVTLQLPVESGKHDGPTVIFTAKSFTIPTLFGLWAAGCAAMALYAAFSYHRVRLSVRASIPLGSGNYRGDIYLCDDIPTPFILGVFNPKIFLPSALSREQQRSVIAHERAHIARLDHWWKPLGFLLLSVHWFNPMVWAAYVLLCRDIELACDEKVIAKMTPEQKQVYSTVLLTCSMPRKAITACPLAFGEAGVKVRIRSILNYRRPSFWIITAAILLCLTVAVLFLTNPLRDSDPWDALRQAGLILEEDGEELFCETVPPELMTGISQEELDQTDGTWFRSAALLEDGSGIYKMNREQYTRNLQELEDRLERFCREIPEKYPYAGHIRSITHSSDFTEFTVTVQNGHVIDFNAGEINDYLGIFARRYSLFTTGIRDREITIHYQDAYGNPAEPAKPNYRLRIGAEGVSAIYVATNRAAYGFGRALGLLYAPGDWAPLYRLDGLESLDGIKIWAVDPQDHTLWEHDFTGTEAFPWEEDGWQLIQTPEWVTIDAPWDVRTITQAIFLYDEQEFPVPVSQLPRLETILQSAKKLQAEPEKHDAFDCIMQLIQQDGLYRSVSLTTDGSRLIRWGQEYYQYTDDEGMIESLLRGHPVPAMLLEFLDPPRVEYRDNSIIEKVNAGPQMTLEALLTTDSWTEQPIPEGITGPGPIRRGMILRLENGNHMVISYDSDALCIFTPNGSCIGRYTGSYTGEQMVDMLWSWMSGRLHSGTAWEVGATLTQTAPNWMLSILLHPTTALNIGGMGAVTPENQEEWIAAWEAVRNSPKTVSEEAAAETYYGAMVQYDGTLLRVHRDSEGFSLRELGGSGYCYSVQDSRPLIRLLEPLLKDLDYTPVQPARLKGIQNASLNLNGMQYSIVQGDPKLAELEAMLTAGKPTGSMSACGFTALLRLGLASGETVLLSVATDSCGIYLSDGVCYEFADDNAALYRLFGIEIDGINPG